MNIYTVRDNLIRTIAGKEKMLAEYREAQRQASGTADIVTYAVVRFLETNLDELYGILNDVQVCCKQDSDASWRDNPDRSGGQFTQDEIDNAGRWV